MMVWLKVIGIRKHKFTSDTNHSRTNNIPHTVTGRRLHRGPISCLGSECVRSNFNTLRPSELQKSCVKEMDFFIAMQINCRLHYVWTPCRLVVTNVPPNLTFTNPAITECTWEFFYGSQINQRVYVHKKINWLVSITPHTLLVAWDELAL